MRIISGIKRCEEIEQSWFELKSLGSLRSFVVPKVSFRGKVLSSYIEDFRVPSVSVYSSKIVSDLKRLFQ
jgi:hypothetical protein